MVGALISTLHFEVKTKENLKVSDILGSRSEKQGNTEKLNLEVFEYKRGSHFETIRGNYMIFFFRKLKWNKK